MLSYKTIAETKLKGQRLSPKEMADAAGTSVYNIFFLEDEISALCKTYSTTNLSRNRKPIRFSIDNLPEEIEMLKNIIAKKKLPREELTTTAISKLLKTQPGKIIANKEEIEKLCPSYKAVIIKKKASFTIQASDLKIIKNIIDKKTPKIIPNKPPQKSARQLNEEAKKRLWEEK